MTSYNEEFQTHDMISHSNRGKGADIASASALTLLEDGDYFDVTGTAPVSSISSRPAGDIVRFQFDGIVTITHNATTLIMQRKKDFTTKAGDMLAFMSEGGGNWREMLAAGGIGIGTIVEVVLIGGGGAMTRTETMLNPAVVLALL